MPEGSRHMGTELGDNIIKVMVRGRFVGMIDKDLLLYQWAPSRETGSVKNFTWHGCMSFGEVEWETLLKHGVKRLEFKDPFNNRVHTCKMKKARKNVRFEETARGGRYLVPHECFKIEDAA